MEQYVLMTASESVNITKEMVESTEKLEKPNSLQPLGTIYVPPLDPCFRDPLIGLSENLGSALSLLPLL